MATPGDPDDLAIVNHSIHKIGEVLTRIGIACRDSHFVLHSVQFYGTLIRARNQATSHARSNSAVVRLSVAERAIIAPVAKEKGAQGVAILVYQAAMTRLT